METQKYRPSGGRVINHKKKIIILEECMLSYVPFMRVLVSQQTLHIDFLVWRDA